MKTKKIKTKGKVTGVTEITEKEIWKKDELDKVREYILKESKKQSPEQKLRNELLSIQFKMEDYIQNNEIENEMNLSDFFKLYLKVLHLKQNQIAEVLEMQDSNLIKYLNGDRGLNPDFVMKLSSFFHTKPELWYMVEIKNNLNKLKTENKQINKYKKYDYRKFVTVI
jgi:plasmid maintenance system antidote protein VapI